MPKLSITAKQSLSIRKYWAPQVRKLGVQQLEDLQPHTLQWKDLHETKKALYSLCQQSMDKLEGAANDEARSIEDAYDGLLFAYEQCISELDTRGKLGNREPRSVAGDPRRPKGDDGECRADASLETDATPDNVWRDQRGQEVRVYLPNQRMSEGERTGVSFGSAIRAVVLGPRNDAERRSLSEGADGAGGYTVPNPLARQFIDRMRGQSIVVQSGAVTVPMDSDTLQIAKLATDPTFSWRAELGAVGTGDPTFSRVLFTAKSCAVLVKCSRELLMDSVNAEEILMQAFANAAGLEMDRAALVGTGADNQPLGIQNVSGVNTVSMGTNGAALSNYDPFLDALYELELDNIPGPYSAAMHPRTARDLRKLKTGIADDNTPLVMPADVASMTRRTSTAMAIDETQGTATTASSVILGNFSEVMIGLREDMRILVLNERYADTGEVGFIAHFRMDIQVRHAESFCVISGIIP